MSKQYTISTEFFVDKLLLSRTSKVLLSSFENWHFLCVWPVWDQGIAEFWLVSLLMGRLPVNNAHSQKHAQASLVCSEEDLRAFYFVCSL